MSYSLGASHYLGYDLQQFPEIFKYSAANVATKLEKLSREIDANYYHDNSSYKNGNYITVVIEISRTYPAILGNEQQWKNLGEIRKHFQSYCISK